MKYLFWNVNSSKVTIFVLLCREMSWDWKVVYYSLVDFRNRQCQNDANFGNALCFSIFSHFSCISCNIVSKNTIALPIMATMREIASDSNAIPQRIVLWKKNQKSTHKITCIADFVCTFQHRSIKPLRNKMHINPKAAWRLLVARVTTIYSISTTSDVAVYVKKVGASRF